MVQGKLQENLESEISILKSFRHGNIVELYDIKVRATRAALARARPFF